MEARSATALTDVTPTGSQTHVLTPDEIPDQVTWMLSRLALFPNAQQQEQRQNALETKIESNKWKSGKVDRKHATQPWPKKNGISIDSRMFIALK